MAVRAAALCLLLAHQVSPALAQAAPPISLVVSEGDKEIGREEFTLTAVEIGRASCRERV